MTRLQHATQLADNMLDALDQAYIRFHRQHNLPKMQVPRLDLGAYRNRLEALMRETEAFCKDPANLLLEKRFMIRRFYAGLAEESRKAFKLARAEAERWLRIALDPIMTRIREHKQYLDTRLASLQRILENMGTLHSRMAQIKQEIGDLRHDKVELARIADCRCKPRAPLRLLHGSRINISGQQVAVLSGSVFFSSRCAIGASSSSEISVPAA